MTREIESTLSKLASAIGISSKDLLAESHLEQEDMDLEIDLIEEDGSIDDGEDT